MASLNTATIGGLPVYEPPCNISGMNRFVMRTGASRYGKGVFAMLRKDYDSLVLQTKSVGGRTELVMKGSPGPGLTLSVILAAAEPIITAVGTNPDADLMKVTVYDRRSQVFTPLKKFYNVTKDGYPLDNTNNPICYASTLKSGSPYAWDDVLTVLLGSSGNLPGSIPSWTPYNLIWDSVPFARAVDDAAAQLFYVVGFDHQQAAVVDSLSFFPPYLSARGTETEDTGFAANFDLLDQADQKKALINGAIPGSTKATERNYNRLPGAISVIFPGTGGSDPYDAHRVYTSSQSTDYGSSDYTISLNVGKMFGVWGGSAWLNQADLDDVASDLAARAAIFISQAFGQAEFAGIWPFRPDGRFRQIEWVSYPKGHPQEGARTIISTDNAKDWIPSDALTDPVNLVSNQEVIGLGSTGSSIGADGTKYIWASGGTGSLVPLTLTCTNPTADGDATHHPTYAYDATNRITGAIFGTGLTPEWGRTNGEYTPGTVGIGYMSGTTAVLLQANELPRTGSGCS